MLANTSIGDDDLLELGERRARAVRDWLVAHEVPAERVFLLPSKAGDSGTADADEPVKNSRVDFSLK
jgi:outer membrane protein OmpA-like peptidoglycan-associated protein